MGPRIQQWRECTEWFVKWAHDNGSTDDQIDAQEMQRQFENFEATLFAMARGFFKTLEELDAEILEELFEILEEYS